MSATKISILVIIVIAVLGYAFYKPVPHLKEPSHVALPWAIEANDDGTSTVFNITLEKTTVKELLETLGTDHELAIISDVHDNSGLEVFYSYFTSGPIKGKLIAQVSIDNDTLLQMQANAASSSYMESGSRKFLLNPADYERIQTMTINNLSLTPSANLDEEIILSRFGFEAQRIRTPEGIEHFLYPDRGVDIALSEESKELIQYVAPRSFSKLSAPLEKLIEDSANNAKSSAKKTEP